MASAALIDALAAVAGLTVSSTELRARDADAQQRIDDLISNNPDHESMVQSLETQHDREEPLIDEPIPTGDELAAELERFLRGEDPN